MHRRRRRLRSRPGAATAHEPFRHPCEDSTEQAVGRDLDGQLLSSTVTTIWAEFPQWGAAVTIGAAPTKLVNPSFDDGSVQMAEGEFLISVAGLGRVHITGASVVVDPAPGRSVDEMDYILHGWVPRLLRILREEFSFHASAVRSDRWALALMGLSGAGKSTTATALTRSGFELIVDDVLPVDLANGVPLAHGWPRPVHLTDIAAQHFKIPVERRVGGRPDAKAVMTLPQAEGRWPLRLAVVLDKDDDATDLSVHHLSGAERLQALLPHTGGAELSASDGRASAYFAWITSIAAFTDVVRITRPASGWHLDAVIETISRLASSINTKEMR